MEKRIVSKMDGILISSKNKNEHFQNLESFLVIMKKYGLRLKKKKCVFMASEVIYLGFRVNKNGVTLYQKK